MKALLIVFACFCCAGLFATDNYFSRNEIMMTEHGIFIVQDGQLTQTNAVTYMGNGIYSSSQEYYGSCGRCGWPLDKEGRCKNQNCRGYGPPERD